MKKSWKNKFILISALMLFAGSAMAQSRDPFSPTSSSSMVSKMKDMVSSETKAQENFDSASPLTSIQLSGYRVTGVLVSEKTKVASIKAMNGVSYLVKIDDRLGSEGGKITNIEFDGVTVQTESQEIKLAVNNKTEASVENSKAK